MSFRPFLEGLEDRRVPAVTYHGGHLLNNVEVQALYYGQQWYSNSTYYNETGNLDGFLQYLVASPYMDMLSQAGYNVGRGTFNQGVIDQVSLNPTQRLNDSAIQSELQSLITGGQLQNPDANRLYLVFVQPGIVVRMPDGSTSHSDFLGYHTSFYGTDAKGNQADIYYAVLAYPGGVNATDFPRPLDTLTETVSHELAESVTDPDAYGPGGWFDAAVGSQDNEIGDIVVSNYPFGQQYEYLNGYLVQKEAGQNDLALPLAGASPLVQVTGESFNPTTGQPFTGPIATFSYLPDSNTAPEDFTAKVNWGDGTSGPGTIVDNGDGTFSVEGPTQYLQPGTFNVSVTVTAWNSASGGATTVAHVTNPNPVQLDATLSPEVWAGQATPVEVQVVDPNGNPLPGYTGTVHFGSSDPHAGLPADYTFTAADGGSHAFSVIWNGTGIPTLTVTDAANGLSFSQVTAVTAGFLGDVSIAVDRAGNEVRDVVYANGYLYQYDPWGVHFVASGVRAAGIAVDGAGNEVRDVVYTDGTLYQYDAWGVHFLGNGIRSASIAVDAAGAEVRDVVSADGRLYQFDAWGVHYLGSNILSASISVDAFGNEARDVVYATGVLFQYDAWGTHNLGGNVYAAAIATDPFGNEVRDVLYADRTLYQDDPWGLHSLGALG